MYIPPCIHYIIASVINVLKKNITGKAEIDQLWEEQRKKNQSERNKDEYDKYVCDDNAIQLALNGSFSIVNGFKDKPSAEIQVPRYIPKTGE